MCPIRSSATRSCVYLPRDRTARAGKLHAIAEASGSQENVLCTTSLARPCDCPGCVPQKPGIRALGWPHARALHPVLTDARRASTLLGHRSAAHEALSLRLRHGAGYQHSPPSGCELEGQKHNAGARAAALTRPRLTTNCPLWRRPCPSPPG